MGLQAEGTWKFPGGYCLVEFGRGNMCLVFSRGMKFEYKTMVGFGMLLANCQFSLVLTGISIFRPKNA